MNRVLFVALMVGCLALNACSPVARSGRSFDRIKAQVAGRTASEVRKLLGAPNHVEKLLLGDERWIWWNYAHLEGEQWAPEVRGKIVHLEITFENPSFEREGGNAKLEPRVSEPYGVGFVFPGEDETRASSLNKAARSGV